MEENGERKGREKTKGKLEKKGKEKRTKREGRRQATLPPIHISNYATVATAPLL